MRSGRRHAARDRPAAAILVPPTPMTPAGVALRPVRVHPSGGGCRCSSRSAATSRRCSGVGGSPGAGAAPPSPDRCAPQSSPFPSSSSCWPMRRYVIAVSTPRTRSARPMREAPQSDDEGRRRAAEDDGFGFAHLWFLWHLLWLVAAFVGPRTKGGPPGAAGATRQRRLGTRATVGTSVPGDAGHFVLGPDTSDRVLRTGGHRAYAFFFGAAQYGAAIAETRSTDSAGRPASWSAA